MQTETMKLRELTVRYSVKKTDAGQPVIIGRAMNTPRESASAVMTVLRDEPGEVFAIICLSTKHRVIAYHEVSRGTLAEANHPELGDIAQLRDAYSFALGVVEQTVLAASGLSALEVATDPTPTPREKQTPVLLSTGQPVAQ